MSSSIVARVHIVRHGETNENLQRIIQGQLDTILNENGIIQAKTVAVALNSTPFDVALSSDLKRTVKTAEAILAYHPGVRLEPQAALRERHMGSLQGVVYDRKKSIKIANVDGEKGGESGEIFVARALRWWQESVLARVQEMPDRDRPYDILAVTHGGFISALVRGLMQSQLMEAPADPMPRWVCLNVSITTVAIRRDGIAVLEKYGDISHLLAKDIASVQVNVDEVKVDESDGAGREAGSGTN